MLNFDKYCFGYVSEDSKKPNKKNGQSFSEKFYFLRFSFIPFGAKSILEGKNKPFTHHLTQYRAFYDAPSHISWSAHNTT